MKFVSRLADIPHGTGGRSLAVGTFDGVHLGHREVIGAAIRHARELALPATVVTFEPHPLRVLKPDDPPRLLATPAIKRDLIASLAVDELVVIPFDEQLAHMEAETFCTEILVEGLGARHVSVGQNFHFGHQARGDATLLQSRDEFETTVVPLLERGGAPVSSSRIRELIETGSVADASVLLGAPFQLEGTVVMGDRRGRELGIPTANLMPSPGALLPAAGVYAGKALGRAAAINVGTRPTFETDGELLVEAYLVDFEGDLYGSTLRLEFLERLRDEAPFASAEELVEQMRRDVERVREITAAAPPG